MGADRGVAARRKEGSRGARFSGWERRGGRVRRGIRFSLSSSAQAAAAGTAMKCRVRMPSVMALHRAHSSMP